MDSTLGHPRPLICIFTFIAFTTSQISLTNVNTSETKVLGQINEILVGVTLLLDKVIVSRNKLGHLVDWIRPGVA